MRARLRRAYRDPGGGDGSVGRLLRMGEVRGLTLLLVCQAALPHPDRPTSRYRRSPFAKYYRDQLSYVQSGRGPLLFIHKIDPRGLGAPYQSGRCDATFPVNGRLGNSQPVYYP